MAANYPEYKIYEWREAEPGRWIRDIDEPETFYFSIYKAWEASGRSFFHMTGHLSLIVSPSSGKSHSQLGIDVDAALQKAWIALRHQHPNIASQTKWDATLGKYVKEYSNNTTGWLEETLVQIPGSQTGEQWSNDDPPAPRLPTLNVLSPAAASSEGPVRRDLVFRAPHDIIDGIGTLILLENYVKLVSKALESGRSYKIPPLGELKVQNLSPPYRVAAGVPSQMPDVIRDRIAALEAAERADSSNPIETVSLPHKKGPVQPGVHKRVALDLSPADSNVILSFCKNKGFTATHVFHAAIALVLRDMQVSHVQARPVRYAGYLLRNERGNCNAPYNGPRHPTGVYHSVSGDKLVVNMTVPAQGETKKTEPNGEEFLKVVQQMQKFYVTVRDDPNHYAIAPYLWEKGTPPLPADPSDEPPPISPPGDVAPVSISSMGRIDNLISRNHGTIQVYNPWVTGEELRHGYGVFLGTFRDSLSLSVAYNDAWHGEDEALEFLQRCVDIVKTESSL